MPLYVVKRSDKYVLLIVYIKSCSFKVIRTRSPHSAIVSLYNTIDKSKLYSRNVQQPFA